MRTASVVLQVNLARKAHLEVSAARHTGFLLRHWVSPRIASQVKCDHPLFRKRSSLQREEVSDELMWRWDHRHISTHSLQWFNKKRWRGGGLASPRRKKNFSVHLEASDAMVSLKLPAVLVPFQSGSRVAAGLAAELDGLTGRDSVKLLLHLLRMSPLWGHGWRNTHTRVEMRSSSVQVRKRCRTASTSRFSLRIFYNNDKLEQQEAAHCFRTIQRIWLVPVPRGFWM